jgi:hypothetical protein
MFIASARAALDAIWISSGPKAYPRLPKGFEGAQEWRSGF